MIKVLVPTYLDEIPKEMLAQLLTTTPQDCRIIASLKKASASVNRNVCLSEANLEHNEIAIMLDDDILGFYPGWIDDLCVAFSDPNVVAVSARLLKPDGKTFGETCTRCLSSEPEEIEIFSNGTCTLPTAAIAFRNRGHRFDENFRGSGFEDNDWFLQHLYADKSCKFIQSNRCRLIHLNEMKGQKGSNWEHNKRYFSEKWKSKWQ